MSVRIKLMPNGPIRVEGQIVLEGDEGQETVLGTEKATFFCRCGRSSNKPFCDGTHKREGWVANPPPPPPDTLPDAPA